jgi:hypothetical protein
MIYFWRWHFAAFFDVFLAFFYLAFVAALKPIQRLACVGWKGFFKVLSVAFS